MKHEYEITTEFFKKIREEDEERTRPVEMDIDMDVENVPPTSSLSSFQLVCQFLGMFQVLSRQPVM